MKAVTQSQFFDTLCKDYNINSQYKDIKRFSSGKVNATRSSIIVDKEGNEFPYMLNNHIRNEDKLKDFDYIYTIRYKSLAQIIEETGLSLKSESCKICEGGGWYSTGTRYYYKDIYWEI